MTTGTRMILLKSRGAKRVSHIYARAGAPLSKRERQVLRAAAGGHTCGETAGVLRVGVESVRWYRRSILVKLQARNITHAVALWMATEDEEAV